MPSISFTGVSLCVLLWLVASAQAAAPVCALLDPEKAPQAALLEAKLLADPAATWVERANVDAVLKEQKLQRMFSPQGVGDRVKLGKLLKAELLVMVRPVKDAKEPALEVVISETAGGLRLLIRGVAITKDAAADVAALHAAVRDGIAKHGEKVKEVVAVPPFVSNDLEFTFDHLKGAFAKLAEVEALDRKGVVVVELAEAEAVGKELALAAPGTKLDRPLPVYLLGEYRHEGKGKDRTVAVKLRAERGGKPIGTPETFTIKPEDSPAVVRKWAASSLDAILADGKPRPPADPKAEARILAERGRVFARLGNWSEALTLVEASLMLVPEQSELHAEALRALVPAIGILWPYPHPKLVDLPRIRSLYTRGYEHLEILMTGSDLRVFRERKGFDLMMHFVVAHSHSAIAATAPAEVFQAEREMLEERRQFALRTLPRLVEARAPEQSYFLQQIIVSMPDRYEVVESLLKQFQDVPGGRERAESFGRVLRWANPMAQPEPKALTAEVALYAAFLDRLDASKNADLRAAAVSLRKSLAEERNDPKRPVPHQGQTLFKPILLEAAAGVQPVDAVYGIIPAGAKVDVLWSSSFLYVMKEKGRVRSVWPAKAEPGVRVDSAHYDGKYVWVSAIRVQRSPLLLILDPETGKVWDVSEAEGFPRGTAEFWASRFNAYLTVAHLGPGRACVAGTIGRAWIATAAFDPNSGHATVKVFHEAREALDRNDPKQQEQTTVEFQPHYMYTLRGRPAPNAPEEARILLGRRLLATRPLIIDPDRQVVEVLPSLLSERHGQASTLDFAAAGDAVYRVEDDPARSNRNRVVRIGWPDFSKTTIVEGLPPGRSYVRLHEKQFHVARVVPNTTLTVPGAVSIPPSWDWWTADLDGKNLRQVANDLPGVRSIAVSAHYGIVAIIDSPGTVTLCTVDFASAIVPKRIGGRLHPEEEKGLASESSTMETTLTFTNKSGQPVRLYWMDFQGNRKLYGELPDGKSQEQKSFVQHAWLVTDKADNAWYVIRPEAKPQTIEIVEPKK